MVKVEARFSQPEGHGFLLTNGTGTGKTWSGLGVVKRFVKQGKSNILIVAPSQGILDGWIDTGRMLGVDITRLPDTKTAGKGIVATTYANLGDNETLADRNWDLIVADEAHKLSQNEAGSPTDALHVLRGLTNKYPYGRARMKLAPELAKLKELEAAAKANQSLRKKYEEANTAYFQKVSDLRDELAKEPRAKALFLSATPFAYRKSTDYAEGFLFDYPELTGRYNSPGGQSEFLQRNFGYAIRYNRAEEPGPEVNVGVLEREFYERLKREGVLSGRRLEVEADYDRRFVLVDDAVGAKIDQAMTWLSSEKKGRYLPLFEKIHETFNYLAQRRLLEAIKAKHVVPRIKRDLELGRKVVVFHDYNEGGGFAPFAPPSNPNERVRPAYGEKEGPTIGELYSEFIKANPYVKTLDFAQFRSPIETLTTAFPEALVYNGRIPNKQRSRARDEFNLDGSGRDIIIVQSAAGEAGISLHDTTGKHQRVLYNLGLPTRPTTAIQQEGRIYREGQVSDAILRYMSTGTGWERTAFSQTIAERASTAENLALGDEARALRDAFIDSFNDADDIPQGADEGRGGKAKDRTMAGTVSPYEKAKAFYFAEGKKRGRRDQREGADYYATPEPIGLKMVEFADVQIGERILEPSAGHGAIARWFPEGANRVLIEPSSNLASRAGLASPGAKVITSRFEDHYIGNKYDAIVMNPPFGAGGKDAIDHVQKAVGHLREGGRVVAILPRGPAADKRLEAFRDSDVNKNIYAALEIDLPPVMFERAGTKVATRLVVFERHSEPSTAPNTAYRDVSDAETINELFDRMENLSLSARRRENQSPAGQIPADVVEPPRQPVVPSTAEVSFKLGETKHSRTGADLYVASIARQVPRTTFDNLLATAKKHKGYYSSFRGSGAIPGFQFPTEENRTAFLQAINGGMREEADQEDFPRVNEKGYILALPYEKEWGNPRFIKADRERAIARLREIQSINADDAPWADLVQARRDIDQIVTNLFYWDPEQVAKWNERNTPATSYDIWQYIDEMLDPESFALSIANHGERYSLFSTKNLPADLVEFADEGGQALDSLLESKRKGLHALLKYADEVDPVKPKKEKPVGALGDKMPSGFYFKAARKIDEARETLFQMSGQAVINWLMKEGVSRAEINHFRLWEKFGGTAKFTRDEFKQAIAERMFDFRRKMSWLNPERSKRDYGLGGTRAFTGPRVPGQGIYFERPIAFPKKLAGGAQFPPGQFESPHWYTVLENAWASWRGSIRDVPGYGKMLVGEEGQSDYMQGASTGRRPKITEQEFLAFKEAHPKYKRVMEQAEAFLLRAIGSGSMADRGTPIWDLRIMLGNDLVPTDNGNELPRPAWDKAIELARKYVKEHRQLYLGESYAALDKLVALRTRFEEFFAPGARDKYDVDLSKRTPQSPIDENYVRVMARDLLLLAAEKNVDSISVSTSSTTARIQNNPRAAHFYDQQMKPALERELRKLTGQWDLSLQKVALPKAMGSPKSERPYTVWAAKLEPATLEKIKQEGVSVFSIADLPRPKVSRLDYVKGRLLLRQPVDLSEDARPIFDMMRSEPSILPGMIPEAVITKLTPKKGTDKYIVTARDQYGEEHTFEDDAKKITRTQGQYLVANGRPLVVLTPLDFGGDFVQTVRTVRAHEAVHALRIAGFLPGGNRDAGTTWGRLVGHADLLGVLHMSRADFYKRLGDPRAATASKDVSTFEVYTTLYGHLNTGLALELYHQEAVAHMMEVYVAGGWTNQEIAPVKAILDDILSGKTAQWTDVREMPLSAGMLRSTADNEDGALGSDRVYSLQDTITGQSMRRDLDSLGFYSKALEAARGLKQEKGTPEQMLAQLKKAGVKDAEIEATGLADLFREKSGSTTALESDAITLSQNPQQQGDRTASPPRRARLNQISKAEIVKHLEENRVGLREVDYGTPELRPGTQVLTAEQLAARDGITVSKLPLKFYAIDDDGKPLGGGATYENAANLILAKRAKWNTYSLDPSNPTYRETVIHLPAPSDKLGLPPDTEFEAIRREADESVFRSGHFPEPNIIGHMMTSMTRHEGKPVYTIDQIQSDWGQALRDEVDPAKADGLREQLKAMGVSELSADMARPYDDQVDGVGMATAGARHGRVPESVAKELAALSPQQYSDVRRIASELKQITDQLKAPISRHPLVNTTDQWTQTTLRRAIRQAVEAGAEYIAVPTGDTVLEYNPGDTNGMRGFYGYHPKLANGQAIEGIVPKNLRKLLNWVDKSTPAPDRIDQLETPSGMKGEGFTLFPLTDKIRQSVMEEGQPMFSIGAYHGSPFDFDRFSLDHIGKGEGVQAFGPGLYFTQTRSLANFYRAKLSGGSDSIVLLDGVDINQPTAATQQKLAEIDQQIQKLKDENRKYTKYADALVNEMRPDWDKAGVDSESVHAAAENRRGKEFFPGRNINSPTSGDPAAEAGWLVSFANEMNSPTYALRASKKEAEDSKRYLEEAKRALGITKKSREENAWRVEYATERLKFWTAVADHIERGTYNKPVDVADVAAGFDLGSDRSKQIADLELLRETVGPFSSPVLNTVETRDLLTKDDIDTLLKVARSGEFAEELMLGTDVSQADAEAAARELEELIVSGRLEVQKSNVGFLYDVTLHVDEDELLLWDEPLSKQSERVQKALEAGGARALGARRTPLSWLKSFLFGNESRVSRFVRSDDSVGALVSDVRNQDRLRRDLLAVGIPGIKYLDGSSRKAGKGTYNYVIFDESKIEITAKNGAPISKVEKERALASFGMTRVSALPDTGNISRDISEAISIITRITGKDAVQVEFRDQISGAEANPAQLAVARAAGFDTRTAGGLYKRPSLDAKALIALATNDPAYDLKTAAGHEAFHHVEEVLANPAEKRLLTSDSEMTRMRALASDEFGMSPNDPRLSRLPATEIRAVAFQRYRRMREEGLADASRLHIGIRRLFDRIVQIFQGVRNVLKGYGYDSYEAIFERARTGKMADPVARRASDRPVRTLRNLIDPQMRPEGYIDREPFDLKDVRLVGRSMASVPLSDVQTIQKSVSVKAVRSKLGLPESDDGRPVSVFKYGDRYYVNDGNHRIEAMRARGAKSIRAEVIEIAPKDGDAEVLADRGPADVQAQPVGAQEDNQGAQAGLSDSDVQASLIPAVAKVYTARWLRRLQPHTDRIRVYLQDKVLPIRRQEEAIEAASGIKLPEHLSVYTAEAIYHGRAGERLTDLQEKYVEPLTQHLRKSNISFDELGDYLYARHAIERNDAIRQIDPTNDEGSGMTDAEAKGIVGMIEQGTRAQAFKTAAGMIDAMVKDARDTLYRAGNLTKEQYDNWTTKYKSYVPLRGFEGEVEEFGIPRVGRGMDIRGPESMQALGRRSKADNPAAYVIQQSVQAIIRSEKNRVDKTLYRLIQAHPDPDVWRVFKGEARRGINQQTGLVETYWVAPPFAANGKNKDNIFGVKIAGKQHYMWLEDGLARSFRTAQPGLMGTSIGRAFYSLSRFYAQLVTSFNPEFVISNYLRDIQTALMNVGDVANAPPDVRKRIRNEALSFKSIRGVMAALQSHEGRTIFGGQRAADENMLGRKRSKEAQDYAKWFEEYRLAGGKISFIEMNDIDRIKNRVEKSIAEGKTRRALRNVFDLIDNANSAVENGVRLSAYIALRKNGVSQDKAAFAARELTVNFNRKGELGPGINAFYLFFNASVQGTTRLAQALTRSPAVRKGAATIILAGVLIDLLNYSIAGNDDDDENAYEKIDDWKKEKNMIVMLPGRKDYVQIPMPYGYNVLYLFGQKMAALARTAAGAGKEKPEKAIAGLLGAMVESFSPMGAAPSWLQMASPTLLDPFTQIAENKSWFGGKIAPEKLPTQKHKPDSEMFFSTAPAWAIDLARTLNKLSGGSTVKSGPIDISPESIEHIAEFLMGGVGKFIGNIWNTGQRAYNDQEWIPEKTPLLRRVYGKATSESRRRDFYEKWNEVDAAHYQFETYRKAKDFEGMKRVREESPAEIAAYEAMRNAQRQVSALRKQGDAINLNRDIDAVQKEKRLKLLIERENEIILRALKTYSRLKKEKTPQN